MVKKTLIFGMGKSGHSAKKLATFCKIPILIYDDKEPSILPLEEIDRVVLSPGVPLNHPLLQQLKGAKIQSEIEWALEFLKKKIIAITGSNGKTTTACMIESFLVKHGLRAKAYGNIGYPLSEAFFEEQIDWIILEISAQQLEMTSKKAFDIAILLNVQPNHLDRYLTMEAYQKAKEKIFVCLKEGAIAFPTPIEKEEVLEKIAFHFGIDSEEVGEFLKTFKGVTHRIEFLGNIKGIDCYNDAKSTTLSSTLYALKKMITPVQLIMGGRSKGESLDSFLEESQGKIVRILAIGEMGEVLKREFSDKIELLLCTTLEKAINEAFNCPHTLLFSPGFTSYDQYNNFEERGKEFKSRVEWIKKIPS